MAVERARRQIAAAFREPSRSPSRRGSATLLRDQRSGRAHPPRRRSALLEQGPRPRPVLDLRPGDRRRALRRRSGPSASRARRRCSACAPSPGRSTPRIPPPASTPSGWRCSLGELAVIVRLERRAGARAERGRARPRRRQDRRSRSDAAQAEPLSASERAQIATTPSWRRGSSRACSSPEQVDWIRTHHERPDGTGYPRGLHGPRDPRGSGAARARRRLGRDDGQPPIQRPQVGR